MDANDALVGCRTITVDGRPVATVTVKHSIGWDGTGPSYTALLETPGGDAWTGHDRDAAGALASLRASIDRSMAEERRALHAVEAYERGEAEF